MTNIIEGIVEAYEKMLKEKIVANTVMIDNSYVKVRQFVMQDGEYPYMTPMMIGGLKVEFTDLPDGVAFYVMRSDADRRDRDDLKDEINDLRNKLERIKEVIGE